MFSATITSLTKLNNAEKQELANLEERIKRALAPAASLAAMGASVKLVNELSGDDYPPRKVLKFSENSEIFRKFFEDNSKSMMSNIALLKREGYLGSNTVSVDRDVKCSIMNEYIGSFLLKEYEQKKNDLYLNAACKLNIFSALLLRCEANVKKIKSNTEIMPAKLQIEADLDLLGNLYWSVGYMHAAYIYLDLGNYYMNKGVDGAAVARDFHEKAAKNFFCAAKLYRMEAIENKKIISLIFQGQTLEEVYNFKNWDAAKDFILNPLANDVDIIKKYFDEASNKIDGALAVAFKKNKPVKVNGS